MEAVEDYVENCANVKVDIEVLESSMEAKKPRDLFKVILLCLTRGGINISWQAEDDSWRVRGKTVHGKRVGKKSGMIFEYQGGMAKAQPCPDRILKTPLPQQSSPSAREEEGHPVVMEDRRRRSIAFEKLAKEILRYLDNSDDVKVGNH